MQKSCINNDKEEITILKARAEFDRTKEPKNCNRIYYSE